MEIQLNHTYVLLGFHRGCIINYSLMCGIENKKEHGAQIMLQVPHPYDLDLFLEYECHNS